MLKRLEKVMCVFSPREIFWNLDFEYMTGFTPFLLAALENHDDEQIRIAAF